MLTPSPATRNGRCSCPRPAIPRAASLGNSGRHMSEEPTHYLCCRSHGDHRLFVVCYADRFYEDVPLEVRNRGPWRGERGES